MKKVVSTFILVTILFVLVGCNNSNNNESANGNTGAWQSTNESINKLPLYPLSTPENVYSEHPCFPAIIFTTTGDDNGLIGTVYSFTGKVLGAFEGLDDTYFVVETEHGNVLMLNIYKSIKDSMPIDKECYLTPNVGEVARFTCIYEGYSDTADMPAFTYGNDDFLLSLYNSDNDSDISTNNKGSWTAPLLTKQVTIHDMTYFAPQNWRSAEATSPAGWYYYPYAENADGLIYVTSSEYNSLTDKQIYDETAAHIALSGFLDGLNDNPYDKEFTKFGNYHALSAYYVGTINDKLYEHKVFAVLTPGRFYCILAAEPNTLSQGLKQCTDDMIDTITITASKTDPPANPPTEAPTEGPTSSLTLEQLNAIQEAKSYLSVLSFSRSGLIDQLVYEGFSNETATFVVDLMNIDWKKQAVKEAESYLRVGGFSKSGLIEQLEYEGFTKEEAEYGVEIVNPDWKEQAAKKAKDYLKYMSFSRTDLIGLLEYEGFTKDEAEYAVNKCGLE